MRIIWVLLLIVLAPLGAASALAQTPAAPPANLSAALALTPDDRILGNKDAPITIVEYASMTCPHCGHFATEVLPAIKKKWIDTGKARLILRDYPLDEPALRAAMIARCAPPDRFYPFVETLFETQTKWVMARDYLAELQRLALLGGMSKKQFDACLADKTLENKVIGSRLLATQQLGVNATPTFFINGTKFDGDPTADAFNDLLTHLSAKS
jgi:protein-disulfide isomerase